MRLRLVTLAVLVALLGGVAASPASAQSLADLVDECLANGGSYQMCRGLYGTLRTAGGLCRDATGNDPACTTIDGVLIDESLVAAHETSWLGDALALQRGLDDSHPLQDELWVHTHNSYNADAYEPTIWGLDRNHIYSMTDQLRMGARAIEIDLHYAITVPNGDPFAVMVCHGNNDAGLDVVHLGCGVNDPLLPPVLAEVRAWMDANPDEVVMLYLENQMMNDAGAHASAAESLDAAFGDLIYKPPTSACTPLPFDTSRKQIHDAGKRIIITGICGPAGSAYNGIVFDFDRGGRWHEGGLDYGDDFTAERCIADRAADNYATNWIRHWGDETGLSAGSGGGGDVSPADAREMTRCGVNMIGPDNLVPFDERLVEMVWSWAPNEPSSTKNDACAVHSDDGRFKASDCSITKVKKRTRLGHKKVVEKFVAHRFACYDGTAWHVTAKADKWKKGAETCGAEGLGSFSVPWNGYENERLKAAKGTATDLWLNYFADGGSWVPRS